MKYSIILVLILFAGSCSESPLEVTSLQVIRGLYCKDNKPFSGKIIQRDSVNGNKLVESVCKEGIVIRSDYYDNLEESLSFVDYKIIRSYSGKSDSIFRIQLGSYKEGEYYPKDYYIDVICKRSFKEYDSLEKRILTLPEVKKHKIESISFKTGELEESFHEIKLK